VGPTDQTRLRPDPVVADADYHFVRLPAGSDLAPCCLGYAAGPTRPWRGPDRCCRASARPRRWPDRVQSPCPRPFAPARCRPEDVLHSGRDACALGRSQLGPIHRPGADAVDRLRVRAWAQGTGGQTRRNASRVAGCGGERRRSSKKARRRPTLPGSLPPSTIGAGGLHCRVRNGNGCFPAAVATGTSCGFSSGALRTPERARARTRKNPSPRPISTGRLNTLPCVHLRPINLVVCQGPYPVNPVGDLISRQASRLDAFSAYPFRRSPTSRALGRTTGTRELRPSRSSRTRDSSSQVSSAHSG
jgi:hypothetical protein